jgi:hypothetical protein
LVLESGNVSAQHIENVLGRLKATSLPESVETTLAMVEPPLADTRRYDGLCEGVSHA